MSSGNGIAASPLACGGRSYVRSLTPRSHGTSLCFSLLLVSLLLLFFCMASFNTTHLGCLNSRYFYLRFKIFSFIQCSVFKVRFCVRRTRLLLALTYGSLHCRLEMERFELLTPCLQGRCSPN